MCERPVTVQLAWNDWLTDTLGHLKAAQLQRQLRPLGYQDLPVEAVAESQDVPLWLGSSVTPDLLPGNLPLTLFSSNDYLGLSAHPAVRHAAAESALRHGLGPRASPVVGGHTPQHAALQATLARLCGTETAMLFPTGFAANLACLPALGGSKDVIIFSDALNHASIIDGTRLACRAGATVQVYVHADAAHLEQLLQAAPTNKRKIVVTDSVFSMDGDLAPLVELAHLKQRFGFLLVIDEAHATLMMGQKGAGLAEALGVEEHIDLHVGTLSKAVGAQGGFIACSHAIREVLLTKSRSFVYSTAPALPIVAAVQAAIDTAEREPEHRQRLWARIQQFSRLTGLQSPSPVFPIILGSEAAALNFSQQLLQLGFYVPAIRPPTVPKGTSRLRISLSAAHSEGDVAALSRSQGLQPLAQRLLGELVAVAGTWRVPRRGHSFESGLSLAAPTYMIWGANTGVGKTLVAAGLAAAVRRSRGQLLYLKPVQSGYPQDCDSRLPATLADVQQEGAEKADELADIQPGRSYAKTLHAWHTPVGPHLAAQLEGQFVSDEKILQDTRRHLNHFHSSAGPGSIALVETAGGVSSPTPSNTVQCEAWQGLSLPAILVGDGRLGGISATLSAQDSLNLRGHTTAAVVVSEVDGLDNSSALRRHLGTSPLGHQVPVLELPALPQAPTRGSDTPAVDAALQAWLGASAAQFDSLLHLLHDSHAQRVAKLQRSAQAAADTIWWPFTQHQTLGQHDITVIDSRCGEHYSVFRARSGESASSGSSPLSPHSHQSQVHQPAGVVNVPAPRKSQKIAASGGGSMQAGSLGSDAGGDQVGASPDHSSCAARRNSTLDSAQQALSQQPSAPASPPGADGFQSISPAISSSDANTGAGTSSAEASPPSWRSSMMDPSTPSPSSVAGQSDAGASQLSWRSSMMDPSHPNSLGAAGPNAASQCTSRSGVAGQSNAGAAQLSWRSSMMDPSHPNSSGAQVPAPAFQHASMDVQADHHSAWRSSSMDPSQTGLLSAAGPAASVSTGSATLKGVPDSSQPAWRSSMMDPTQPSTPIQHTTFASSSCVDGMNVAMSSGAVRPAAADAAGMADQQAGSGDLPGRDVKARLDMQYDACASWWTQGVSAHLQPKIVQAMAHAAGRWGHVIFPESTHEPALECTRLLLQGPGKGWASRVFFSDNGSTAIEVALKMAFRKFMADNQYFLSSWQSSVDKGSSPPQLGVLGLTNAYHGDTLGTMDAVAPSPYNGIKQTPWYTARGLFLDPPTLEMIDGEWCVVPKEEIVAHAARHALGTEQSFVQQFKSRDCAFAVSRDADLLPNLPGHRSIASIYDDYIEEQMDVYHRHGAGAKEHRSVGACIIEPVMQGAGGMIIPDPAFQRSMVCVCRKKGIPVIFDEVFSGLWRLGTASAAERLGVRPDIACFAKLLTGGMIPLAVTLATAPVFAAFQNDSKLLALLHGHSYSAHATGCAAAVAAMRIYSDPEQNPNLCHPAYRDRCHQSPACSQPCGRLLELWDLKVVQKLSKQVDVVQHVVAIGTVLAITLRTEPGQQGSYGLESAKIVTRQLKQRGIYARPLGNVVYVMCTPTTSRKQCATLLDDVVSVIIN
ncbi:hypothetical protein WJX74_003664 [Apatococcus lobatus]|uniref:Aminotransferase class I/classII large domain-containing protein n=1 Tax=Apatococcus lobatus TaxID=904363 RepID=A0AAW1RVF6_9CHLO